MVEGGQLHRRDNGEKADKPIRVDHESDNHREGGCHHHLGSGKLILHGAPVPVHRDDKRREA